MIIISETPKTDIMVAIDTESANIQGLSDTLALLKDSGNDIWKMAEAVVQKNAVLKGIENDLRRSIHPTATLLGSIEDATTQLKLWIPKLRVRIEKSPTKVYDTETITFKEKGILDTVSSINFWNRYATTVLDILLSQANKEEDLKVALTKVDLAFFNDTAKYFSHLTAKFCDSVKNLDTMIEDLSEETYDNVSEEVIMAQLGANAVSVQKNLAFHHLNPLYWWKNRQMKKAINTIKANNENIDMLAMKIARLNNRRYGTENPDLDRQIEVYQDAIIKKRAESLRIEAKYNGNRI